MKYSFTSVALLAATVIAAPTAQVDYTQIDYPQGTGENLGYYPPPPGGWESVDYPADTGANAGGAPTPAPGNNGACSNGPFQFTSTFSIVATPDQVIDSTDNTTPTGGLAGAQGFYNIGINSETGTICYDIRLTGYDGTYQSMAKTSTHCHEGARGANGPPRIAFPNPVATGNPGEYRSVGCLVGPFTTGLASASEGLDDSGTGFTLDQIEANPAGFFCDVHSTLAVPGAVRGQLA